MVHPCPHSPLAVLELPVVEGGRKKTIFSCRYLKNRLEKSQEQAGIDSFSHFQETMVLSVRYFTVEDPQAATSAYGNAADLRFVPFIWNGLANEGRGRWDSTPAWDGMPIRLYNADTAIAASELVSWVEYGVDGR